MGTKCMVHPKPFFFEEVGDSAWSLAIHAQSRLLAVGTNEHAVEIFAPALSSHETGCDYTGIRTLHGERYYSFKGIGSVLRDKYGTVRRDFDWKLKIRLHDKIGHNVPAIAFTSDIEGNAESIIAKDVRGALWFLSLWQDIWKRIATVAENDSVDFEPE